MEHDLPLKKLPAILLAAYAALAAAITVHADDRHLVMVAATQSAITAISPVEVRRAYFGVPIVIAGHEVRPLRNHSDPLAREIFLQKTLFMSAAAYERQITMRTFRGGAAPPSYEHLDDLLDALYADGNAITFMSHEIAAGTPGIKIIGEL
jgi:type IV secretory pathway TrbD component